MVKEPQYKFENVICERVIDGDTIDVIIDLGFKIKIEERLRLNRIDTPEIRGAEKIEGQISKDWLEQRILGKNIKIETFKKGKYGRYLAEIYTDGRNLNDDLVSAHLAEYKKY